MTRSQLGNAVGPSARGCFVVFVALASGGCATLSPKQADRATAIAAAARSQDVHCASADACAVPSTLRQLGYRALAETTPEAPRHYALLLDDGQDALLARLNLIRSAKATIDLQTYIFAEDDAGQLFLAELLDAARRGVRLLIDQLSALERVETLAALSGAHRNFELRVYNPTLGRGRANIVHYAMRAACCFRRLSQRMHSKVLLADGTVAITGGRNVKDDYFGWSERLNFRDRDVLVAGPVVRDMSGAFAALWDAPRSVPAERLTDVGRQLLRHGVPALPTPTYRQPERVALASDAADEPALIETRLVAPALAVGAARFVSDPLEKHAGKPGDNTVFATTAAWRGLMASGQQELLVQTPYLVLSRDLSRWLQAMGRRPMVPRVVLSTNSLGSTDTPAVYALTHKYKSRLSHVFGMTLHEYKPYPGVGWEPAGADVPRRGLHAKSFVVDERIGVVGSHNLDPRSDRYNIESLLVVDDPAFARALAASIHGDIAPENSWVIGPRDEPRLLPKLAFWLGKKVEYTPLFDLWPVRNATRYEFTHKPECELPMDPKHPAFRECHKPVGDFAEVRPVTKFLTRIFVAFGGVFVPIL